ncbi:MAG: ATPase, T2SS/T4P/T4SS family [Alphaproteobacteria bacterium]|nr:ATPase, T2SS/T4P/T4SS family [Alphaproteobacteria bacterium]
MKNSLRKNISPPDKKPLRLGELLLQKGKISSDHIQIALHEQRGGNEPLGEILVRLGFLSDESLASALAEHTGRETVDLKSIAIDPETASRVPHAIAERCRVIPISFDGTTLRLAVADPLDIGSMDEVRRYFPRQIEIEQLIASETDIAEVLEAQARDSCKIDKILQELEGKPPASATDGEEWQHPVVRLVDAILTDAVREGASDIHLEPENSFVRLRVRIDGVLQQKRALHLSHWPQLSHRLKIMAGMNIADTRSMQDGRFYMQIGGADIDFRMAIMPTVRGENIVIRILDRRRALLPLESLGYDAFSLRQIERILARPEGVVLVTGPTGSGKTTTLYAMLKRLSSVDVNIMTLEEPVEYQFEMVRQTAIQDQHGLGFAEGVRGILRQAPDIIFIGEIRDDDTARMALRAAMTGHRVFSTLHCNDSFGALPRLNDLGLSSRMMAGNVSGILAQRLVRKLCPKCKHVRPATAKEEKALNRTSPANLLAPGFAEAQASFEGAMTVADAKGCEHCGHTGYKGRTAVVEILRITPELEDLISSDAPRVELKKQAEKEGVRSMSADGIMKVLRHETSFDELRRNVDLTRMP